MATVEVYPMKKSPNRWAWRLIALKRVLCKSQRPFTSVARAMENFEMVSKIFEGKDGFDFKLKSSR